MRIRDAIDIKERVAFGMVREPIIIELIKKLFCSPIKKSLHSFSFFDCYDEESCYLIELKSLRYSFKKYNTCIMNTSKLKFSRIVFVWEYLEDDGSRDLYYHLYDAKNHYNERDINEYNNLACRDVIDVNKCDVEKFEFDTEYVLENDYTDNEKEEFDFFIRMDLRKGLL
jgi:hypothetical protein